MFYECAEPNCTKVATITPEKYGFFGVFELWYCSEHLPDLALSPTSTQKVGV